MTKYKEIFRLKKMLEDADIPFQWETNFGYNEEQVERLKKNCSRLIRALSY